MIDFSLDTTSGKATLDGITIKSINEIDRFLSSNFYSDLSGQGQLIKCDDSHYYIKHVKFMDEPFRLSFFFSKRAKIAFYLTFIWGNGDYIHNMHDWNKVVQTDLLKKEVITLSNIYKEHIQTPPTETTIAGNIWDYHWGRVEICYNILSYNLGLYIRWK